MSGYFIAARNRQLRQKRILLLLSISFFMIFTVLAYLVLRPDPLEATTTKTIITEEFVQQDLVSVLVPIRTIEPGQALKPALFTLEKRPGIGVDDSAINDFEQIKGYYARTAIAAGQTLHMEYITTVKPNSVISSNIPAGYRAVTINVDATSGVEGWALPGSRVDVLWASRIRGEAGVTLIVQNAKVLSSNRQATAHNQPDTPVPATVTLLVSARDAQKIQLASTTGSLALSLRGDADAGSAEQGGSITTSDLLGTSRARPQALPRSKGTITFGGMKWGVGSDGKLVPLKVQG